MARIRSQDMKPEMEVRRMVHGMGYRYRLHGRDLPGKPDLVFPARRKVIFVHGCFWHQHADPQCPDGARRKPKSNKSYWNPKLSRNVERDGDNQRRLEADGWGILVIWECEIKKHKDTKEKLIKFLEG